MLRVRAEGTVTQVAELTSPEVGASWIAVSNELRRAAVVPRNPVRAPVKVVDLDSAAVVTSCVVPAVGFAMEQWIWNVPGMGPQYVEYVGDPGGGDQLRGTSLDPAVPCVRSFSKLTPTEAKYLPQRAPAWVPEGRTNVAPLARPQRAVLLDPVLRALHSGRSRAEQNREGSRRSRPRGVEEQERFHGAEPGKQVREFGRRLSRSPLPVRR